MDSGVVAGAWASITETGGASDGASVLGASEVGAVAGVLLAA